MSDLAHIAAVIDPEAFRAAEGAAHYGGRRTVALAKAAECRDLVLDVYRDRLIPKTPEWRG